MNVLVFDTVRSIARLTRSLLLAQGHRVSISGDSEDACRKIETTLFDLVVIGPAGAPREFAEFLDEKFADLPVILAGVEIEIPPQGRVRAVVPNPLNAARFVSAVEKVARSLAESASQPVEIFAGGDRVLCLATRFSGAAMLLEPGPDVLPERFTTFFREHPRVEAAVDAERRPADVAFAEGRLAGLLLS